jgi:hypothetical protein
MESPLRDGERRDPFNFYLRDAWEILAPAAKIISRTAFDPARVL